MEWPIRLFIIDEERGGPNPKPKGLVAHPIGSRIHTPKNPDGRARRPSPARRANPIVTEVFAGVFSARAALVAVFFPVAHSSKP